MVRWTLRPRRQTDEEKLEMKAGWQIRSPQSTMFIDGLIVHSPKKVGDKESAERGTMLGI